MACKNCDKKPVITLSGTENKLCKNCFIKYFEKKVFKTVQKFNMISKGEKIGVCFICGKDSLALLNLINKFADKKVEIGIKVIAINEDNSDSNEVKDYCNENKLELEIYSFREEFGYTLKQMVKKLKLNESMISGIFRRFLLNKKSRSLKVDKLATSYNLDDEAGSVLMNQLNGNLALSSRLGPVTSVLRHKKFIPRIKPLYFLSQKEVDLYSSLKKFPLDYSHGKDSYRTKIQDMLNELEKKHPQVKYSIVKSFLDILPMLKKKYGSEDVKLCGKCKEPSSSKVCKVCELMGKLN